jgi:hypothetical protein
VKLLIGYFKLHVGLPFLQKRWTGNHYYSDPYITSTATCSTASSQVASGLYEKVIKETLCSFALLFFFAMQLTHTLTYSHLGTNNTDQRQLSLRLRIRANAGSYLPSTDLPPSINYKLCHSSFLILRMPKTNLSVAPSYTSTASSAWSYHVRKHPVTIRRRGRGLGNGSFSCGITRAHVGKGKD